MSTTKTRDPHIDAMEPIAANRRDRMNRPSHTRNLPVATLVLAMVGLGVWALWDGSREFLYAVVAAALLAVTMLLVLPTRAGAVVGALMGVCGAAILLFGLARTCQPTYCDLAVRTAEPWTGIVLASFFVAVTGIVLFAGACRLDNARRGSRGPERQLDTEPQSPDDRIVEQLAA